MSAENNAINEDKAKYPALLMSLLMHSWKRHKAIRTCDIYHVKLKVNKTNKREWRMENEILHTVSASDKYVHCSIIIVSQWIAVEPKYLVYCSVPLYMMPHFTSTDFNL